jgi:hypothetical protein
MNETATLEMPAMTANDEALSIPLDLSQWVPVPQLREWIKLDVASLDWASVERMEVLRPNPDFEPEAVLNSMALAYATGVFTADEIARRCSADIEFRTVRPKLPPIPAELKAFRKENRAVFKWCLTKVITRALKTQFVEGDSVEDPPPGVRRYVVENAVERLELARHLDRSAEL